VSFAAPNSPREEIDRQMVVARRSLEYAPGLGGSIALSTQAAITSRVGADVIAGISARRYFESSTMTILRLPEGMDSERAARALPDERFDRVRSGLLLGFGIPFQLARHLIASPEVRWVWGGPARVGNNYDELSAGVRVAWQP
jgi:hypothetical protein